MFDKDDKTVFLECYAEKLDSIISLIDSQIAFLDAESKERQDSLDLSVSALKKQNSYLPGLATKRKAENEVLFKDISGECSSEDGARVSVKLKQH